MQKSTNKQPEHDLANSTNDQQSQINTNNINDQLVPISANNTNDQHNRTNGNNINKQPEHSSANSTNDKHNQINTNGINNQSKPIATNESHEQIKTENKHQQNIVLNNNIIKQSGPISANNTNDQQNQIKIKSENEQENNATNNINEKPEPIAVKNKNKLQKQINAKSENENQIEQINTPNSSPIQNKSNTRCNSPNQTRNYTKQKENIKTRNLNAPNSPSSPKPRTKEQKYENSLDKFLFNVHCLDKEYAQKRKEQVYVIIKEESEMLYQNKVFHPTGRNEKAARSNVQKLMANNEELERLYQKMSNPESMSPDKLRREIKRIKKDIQEIDEDINIICNENSELEKEIFIMQQQINNKENIINSCNVYERFLHIKCSAKFCLFLY